MSSKKAVPLTPESCSGRRASATLSLFLWKAWPSCSAWEPPSVHPTIKQIARSTTTHRRSSIGICLMLGKILSEWRRYIVRTSENAVKAKFTGELTYPIAPALMLQVAGRDVGHSLRSANISLQQEGIHHCAYLSIGVTSSSGVGLCGMSGGVISWVLGCGYAG